MSKLKGREPETVKPGKCKGVIFGASGVGKTWFSLAFPSPFYIDTEGGADLAHYQERLKSAGGVYLGPTDGALDFDVILDQIKALATEKHGYKTLIIDSITKVFQSAIATEQERLGDKDAFGASKKPAVSKMRRLINWTERLDMNVWFVAHEAAEWGINPKNGQREEVGRIPDVWDKLIYELDLGVRVVRRGTSYPAIGVVTKSRLTGFHLCDSFELTYDEFGRRYGKDAIEAATSTVELASAEQVASIIKMVESLKVPAEECYKVLGKAKADSWAELSSEQAVKTIAWLNKKIEELK